MIREIKSSNSPVQLDDTSLSPDDYKDRLVKLIPTEIVTAYITIQGIFAGLNVQQSNSLEDTLPSHNTETLLWFVFIFLTVLTPVYMYFITKVRKWPQIILTTIAFVIWVIVIGGPIHFIFGFPAALVGSIILILFSLFIPLIYKG